jgi:TRAP-type mannitol/chloroaromatic compound transport system substrate-binding protein
LSAGISRKLWDSLSSSDQALFTAAALAENDYGLAEFNAHNQAALEALVNEHGVQLRQFSDEIYRGFGEAARDVVAKAGQSDELSKRVYESYSSFRRTIIRWSQIADQGFMNQRALVDFG